MDKSGRRLVLTFQSREEQKKELQNCNLELSTLRGHASALLNDANGILIKPGENTQAGRWTKFTSVREVVEMEAILKAYIYEAVEVEKAGLKVNFKKSTEFIIPEEFQSKLAEIPALKTAFDALTPGRQRGYILYFSAPKQSKTRESRVERCMPQILNGKGLNDQ